MIPREDLPGTIIKYKEIIFGADTSICTECLNDIKTQQVIDKIVHNQKLMNNVTVELAWLSNGDMMIGKRIGEVLGPEVDYTCYIKKF